MKKIKSLKDLDGYKNSSFDSFNNKKGLLDLWNKNKDQYSNQTRNNISKLYDEFYNNKNNKSNEELSKLFDETFNVNNNKINNELFAKNKDGQNRAIYKPSWSKSSSGANGLINSLNDLVNNIDNWLNSLDKIGFGFDYVGVQGDNYRKALRWAIGDSGISNSSLDEYTLYNLMFEIDQNSDLFMNAIGILDSMDYTIAFDDIDNVDYIINDVEQSTLTQDEKEEVISMLMVLKGL